MSLDHAAFDAMRKYPQWITVRLVPQASGKTKKLPVNPANGRIDSSAHDRALWMTYARAVEYVATLGAGHCLGFVFTAADPFGFIDLDDCRQDDGWSQLATQVLSWFPGAAVEVSQSGRGLHIFFKYTHLVPHRSRNDAMRMELYTDLRFAAMTGEQASGDSGTVHQEALEHTVKHLFPPVLATDAPAPTEWSEGPVPEWNGPLDDKVLIERALRSRSSASTFGDKASFADLWEGNTSRLAVAFPPSNASVEAYNASSADAAMAAHLMFWTGRDCPRVERLMRQSALRRAKWDDRDDYLRERTIMNAVRMSRDVLSDKHPEASPAPLVAYDTPQSTPVTGNTFLGAAEQAQLFQGCVYVLDQHRALIPGGALLRPDQFKSYFGGYSYAMDAANQRTSRNAWEAFTESQVLRAPRVDGVCFCPDKPFACIVPLAGRTLVNTYWPIETPRKPGDPAPFILHLEKVLPVPEDREILLCYMAAVVQHKGIKFQWAPLLQGVEGNGKSLFTRCVAEAIGKKYTHMPPAQEISEKFNSWLFGTIFIGVEDVYVPEHKSEILEVLKPYITSDYLPRRAMNTDQVMMNVCCNFIFNSNHHDAIRKTFNDRRFSTFFTAQQAYGDLTRDGMTGDYFPSLYRWLKEQDGYAIVSELLHTYPINPRFNPAGQCQRAPETSTTAEAIRAGLGRIEQEVLEAIEQGRPGFAGGWVSSIMLGHLLRDVGGRLTQNKRRDLLATLGYEWHPGLKEGRCTSVVMPDGGRTKLFIARGHRSAGMRSAAEIANAYQSAQMVTT